MSEIALEIIDIAPDIKLYRWVGMTEGDTGEILYLSQSTDKTVQVAGTFGEGGSVNLRGSNYPKNETKTWATLHKSDISDLTFTVADIFAIIDNTVAISPEVTAGDETTDLDVSICCAKTVGNK